jgi:glyoxylase-like metal-dependent hydrolase (beta-lactamase superfamily II)
MSTHIPFQREMAFDYGVIEQVSPLIRRIVARNPGPFTFHGTGTYIVGRGEVAVIDPGPDLAEHVDALLAALAGETITHQLVTHTHRDHSPAARLLREATGAATWGFGPHGRGAGGDEVEEGADRDFVPDTALGDGDVVEGPGWRLAAVHTPGHTSNHLCFALAGERALFTGDHVMGWSTSVVSPPDGDMGDYLASLDRLSGRDDAVYWPTHGPPVRDPAPFVRAFIAHRRARERQILDCLARGLDTIPRMVAEIYADIDPGLHPAAARSLLAHLLHMAGDGRIACDGAPGTDSRYGLALGAG